MKNRITLLLTTILYCSSISFVLAATSSHSEKTQIIFQESIAMVSNMQNNRKVEIAPVSPAQSSIRTDTIKNNDASVHSDRTRTKKQSSYNKFLVSFNYGLGYRTAGVEKGTPAIEKNFQNELRSGNSFQIKGGYKPNKNSYYGLLYSNFSSSTSLSNVIFVEPNGFESAGSTSQINIINYIGLVAGWSLKGFLKNDTFNFDMSLGYINFSEERKFQNTYTAKGGNLGIGTDLSYYFGLNKHFKIGPTFSFSGGAIKNYNITGSNGYSDRVEFDEKTFLSLYRIDLMLGTYFEF